MVTKMLCLLIIFICNLFGNIFMDDLSIEFQQIWQRYPMYQLMKNVQAELIPYQITVKKNGEIDGNGFGAKEIAGKDIVGEDIKSKTFTEKWQLLATAIDADTGNSTIDNKQTIKNTYKNHNNCFVISPYANLVNYAKDELHKLPTLPRYASLGLINGFAKLLASIDIDKVQVLANCLMTTNILSQELQQTDVKMLTKLACERLPEHTLIIRSLNEQQHSEFIRRLKAYGWLPVVNRQVYLITDWQQAQKRRDYKRDMKLLADRNYQFEQLTVQSTIQPITQSARQSLEQNKERDKEQDKWQIAIDLYDQLYLDKYSMENVQFTAVYLRELVQAGILKLYLLYDKGLARYVGMVATMSHENTMTIPLVGYDTDLPQSKSLYRRVMIFAMNEACKENKLLHISAGAPQFKRHRGAVPTLEYMMVYVEHLPSKVFKKSAKTSTKTSQLAQPSPIKNKLKKLTWRALSQLSMSYYAPMLQKLEL